MKEICHCQCNNSRAATTYCTPWCNLLHPDTSSEMLHLWYKLDVLLDEIEKRSSYLGKFRRTEESQHLLDLIAMTKDEEDLFVPFAKASMGDVFDALQFYLPKTEKNCLWCEGKETIIFSDEPTLPDPAILFYQGDYVEYNGTLFRAIEDGDSNDFAGKLVPTEDYRKSIHYILSWDCEKSNINAVEPLDTAIFEALVARILYKWLSLAYPDEAERYLAEWNEYIMQIRRRAAVLHGGVIVHRIPRIF